MKNFNFNVSRMFEADEKIKMNVYFDHMTGLYKLDFKTNTDERLKELNKECYGCETYNYFTLYDTIEVKAYKLMDLKRNNELYYVNNIEKHYDKEMTENILDFNNFFMFSTDYYNFDFKYYYI